MNAPERLLSENAAENGSRASSLSDRVRSLRLPDRPMPQPFNLKFCLPWMLCAVLGLGLLISAWKLATSSGGQTPRKEDVPGSSDGKGVKYLPADSQKEDIALEVKGYIVPVRQIQVSPKVSGMVLEMYITEGKRVKEGDQLAVLEPTEYEAEFNRAKGLAKAARHRWEELWKYREKETLQAKADLDEALTLQDQLYKEWRRNATLRTKNALAALEYEQAESNFKAMEFKTLRLQIAYDLLVKGPRDARIGAAKGELLQAEADLAKAQWRLENCTVRAPVSGTILTKKAEKGNMVNPAAFSNGLAASLCDMADLSDMEVDLSIAERDIGKVFVKQKCLVRAEAYLDRVYAGEVSRVMPMADRSKAAIPVRVKIAIPRAEEGQYLRPEMGALVTFFKK